MIVATACASACAVLLLDFTGAVLNGPDVTAAVPPSDPESEIGIALATSDLRKADPPPLRLETLHDLNETGLTTACSEGAIVGSEKDRCWKR